MTFIEIQSVILKSLHIKIVSVYVLQWIVLGANRCCHILVEFYLLIIFCLFMLEETLPFWERCEYCERETKGQ